MIGARPRAARPHPAAPGGPLDALTVGKLVLGFVLLTAGAEGLVRGAARIALGLGVAPLLVGLTIVAYGTSAPEVAVSVGAALDGQADLAVGNVVGSNIFNVLFVLGLAAALAPLVVGWRLVRLDVPIMVGVSLLMLVLAADGSVTRLDGVLLVAGGAAYTAFCGWRSRGEPPSEDLPAATGPPGASGWTASLALLAGGLALLVVGSRALVDAAVELARTFGVSELVVGLTVVAAGTSLPEAATSVVATVRGQREIAVGNVIGSNIFNVLLVLGLAATVAPGGIPVSPAVRSFDLPFMAAVSVACLPIFFSGYRIARWEGLLFLAYFVAWNAWVILAATEHDALDEFSTVMLEFVLPLTVLTLGVVSVRAVRNRRRARQTGG